MNKADHRGFPQDQLAMGKFPKTYSKCNLLRAQELQCLCRTDEPEEKGRSQQWVGQHCGHALVGEAS